ncbi:MAG: hypothetical protein KJ879_01010 [Nanoarchaeota archaeon]|nr:hypothetical protein [Nanoarchaeota archaeon]
MRASSVGLEVFVEISREEFSSLKRNSLTGSIRFRDNHGSPQRQIPFTLVYSPIQRNFLSVRQIPDQNYFGHAKRVDFTINEEFYDSLREMDRYGDRFSIGGKLDIQIE